MSRAIFRASVPIDDLWHTVQTRGPILHVACQQDPRVVEVWYMSNSAAFVCSRQLRVYGTGQPIDDDATRYIGTALAADGKLVWHIMEREI